MQVPLNNLIGLNPAALEIIRDAKNGTYAFHDKDGCEELIQLSSYRIGRKTGRLLKEYVQAIIPGTISLDGYPVRHYFTCLREGNRFLPETLWTLEELRTRTDEAKNDLERLRAVMYSSRKTK